MALSFQERVGCDEIWEKICQIQGKDPTVDVTQNIEYDGESDSESGEGTDSSHQSPATSAVQLPAPDISKLPDLCELFNSCLTSPIRKEHLALAIENER